MLDIAPLIALASGIGAALASHSVYRRRHVNAWPTTSAHVDHTEVEVVDDHHRPADRDDHPQRFLARVHYRFEVEGNAYRSDNGRFDDVPSFATRDAAEAFLARTPPGSPLTIRYSPTQPTLTQCGDRRIPVARLGLSAFLALMCALAAWLSLR
ncbi:DUF3592 domain-containing protein [Halomonas sp. THAF12]|uniref:DUF3592 domain-containing protein n=1 Tax=Halomonas sp. B23F22_10 TaxID=3459515 RepID=UPI00373E720D